MSKLPIKSKSTIKGNILTIIGLISERFSSIGAIILCLIFMLILNTNNIVSKFVNKQAIKVISQVYQVINFPFETINMLVSDIERYTSVINENEVLRKENSYLKYQLKQMETEINFNISLKKLLNVVESSNYEFITAKVISKSFDNFHVNLLINAGSKHGVKENDIVVYNQDLIGRIIEVSETSSRILTIADPQSKLPIIFQDSGEQAIAIGNPNNKNILAAKYITNPNIIHEGEQVITSGMGGVFPFGIIVGTARVFNNDIFIVTTIDWNKLDYVVVNLSR
ncbi:hypothetical protein NF27_CG00350 [Candidatus Jidaibacter acanthamoeba]|uniref:Cell shape-determining protein MreC n=1 Tax=Candidatus Jidaibacter acanthamoebae TaxID=86105 RepID=A0A0C1R0L0_9RICK|nr:rod shape-determining protein MreC [Candidatus Jidaibacter acanthamoeba]KIE05855.1 hypothetical protein NF27_CG00350 [Candidatus Jidaibacter acanthamoeba]